MEQSASNPSLSRTTIAFFGLRNSGKSSLVNAVTSQNLSIVSDVKGTTTDPVKKVMEILPIGPVTIIDTPGIDDEGDLGKLRVEKTLQVLNGCDIAILVSDSERFWEGGKFFSSFEKDLISTFEKKNIPYLVALNKLDLLKNNSEDFSVVLPEDFKEKSDRFIFVSAKTGKNIFGLKEKIASIKKLNSGSEKTLVQDALSEKFKLKFGDFVILVTPIDESAPKNRLILPQQMALRNILEMGAIPVCCEPKTLLTTIEGLKKKPSLVITDSQVFKEVNALIPAESEIPLTSFSILMSNFKGTLNQSVKGAQFLEKLKDGDTVLISEGCTHHRQCNDIGTVKLPSWIKNFCKKEINFEFTSGGTFPKESTEIKKFALVIHCGGCMLNEREMQFRMDFCLSEKVPFTNYGIAIAHMNGILERSLKPLSIC